MSTELPKTYNHKEVEDKIYRLWEESGFFNPDNLPDKEMGKFVATIAPPNITGELHIGHALENTLEDIIIRMKRMQGYKTLWVPGTDQANIDLIAVTRGPGLGPALLVGLTFARTIAWLHKKSLVGVNHLEGHIYSNWLKPIREISNSKFLISKQIFPALNLIVSGGHTELVLMKNHGQYKIIGETVDDAVGEAFDKVARLLGLGYPGGPAVSKIAKKGNPDKYPLPRPMINSKNYNFSYSGLKTAVLYLIRDLNLKKIDEQTKADIVSSFQKSAIDVLVQKTMRAAKEFKVKSVLLSGGVSANKLLRSELQKNTTEAGIKYFQPPMEYTTDNATMIAIAGYFNHKQKTELSSVVMDANLSL